MRADALAKAIAEDRAAGLTPAIVTSTIGTTGTGAVDPVARIADIAGAEGTWHHVDAAWAGSAMCLPESRHLQAGVEHVDSYTFNPHKWMFTNFDCNVLWVADREPLISTLSIVPPYLRNEASESGAVIDYRDWHVPLGRRFRALKLWWVLRHYGVSGIRHHIAEHIRLAADFARRVDDEPALERVAPVPSGARLLRAPRRERRDQRTRRRHQRRPRACTSRRPRWATSTSSAWRSGRPARPPGTWIGSGTIVGSPHLRVRRPRRAGRPLSAHFASELLHLSPGAGVDDLTPRSASRGAPARRPARGCRARGHGARRWRSTRRTPASTAARASMSVRSSRSGCALISRNVPVSTATSKTRSKSSSYGGRLLILRPVGWPMQSTCGFCIAAIRRSVSRSRGAVEAGVDRGHDPVALRQRLVVEVEAPVGADVDLDARENRDARRRCS